MKCTVILVATLGLVLCALSAWLYQPDAGRDKTPGNNRSRSPPDHNHHLYCYCGIDTGCGGNTSCRTRC